MSVFVYDEKGVFRNCNSLFYSSDSFSKSNAYNFSPVLTSRLKVYLTRIKEPFEHIFCVYCI